MEKTINYKLGIGGVFPEEALCGGFQGENNATALTFEADSELLAAINRYTQQGKTVKVKIDAVTASGERVKSEFREGDNLFSPFYLSSKVTSSGLDTVVVLRVIVDPDEKELCKAQMKLYFIPSIADSQTQPAQKDTCDELEKLAEEIVENVEERAKRIEELMNYKFEAVASAGSVVAKHLKDAQMVSKEIEEARRTLEEGTVFVFSGGDANSAVKDLVTVDDRLSAESENPVQNKVVAEEIKSVKEELNLRAEAINGEIDSLKRDYVVETVVDTQGWYLRKWSSAIFEAWIKATVEFTDTGAGYAKHTYKLPLTAVATNFISVHMNAQPGVTSDPAVHISANVSNSKDVIDMYVTAAGTYQISAYVVGRWKEL